MWALATVEDGGPVGCLVADGRAYPLATLGAAGKALPDSVLGVLADWPKSHADLSAHAAAIGDGSVKGRAFSTLRPLAPLRDPGKVLCAGANYYDHMAEMGFPGVKKETQRLFFFFKTRNSVVGPGATVVMPRGTQKFDWEIELAAVIGRRARYVTPATALDHVAGYTVAIDFSARDFNQAPDQFYKFDWVAGKAIDTGCPMGPWIVTADRIADPQNLALTLSVNGIVKQDSNTSRMIYSVAEQIARASEIMTLDPGDVLLTGTPAGVGAPKGTFLAAGDRVEATIEGIGTLAVEIKPPL
jgi:2-keto-4-pentenoate hydratase/2-oxohepta-3-ene-1,7-dioic acid hydratase in catechol pathway